MNHKLIKKVISALTGRKTSFFLSDLDSSRAKLKLEIEGNSVLVIGGAGTIGSNFIKELLYFNPTKLVVVDINENGLAELVRDIRSTECDQLPEIIKHYGEQRWLIGISRKSFLKNLPKEISISDVENDPPYACSTST